jgi:hypothetical protein
MTISSLKTGVMGDSLLVGNTAYDPNQPIPVLGAWTSGTAIPSSDINAYWGWTNVSGSPRVYHAGVGRSTTVYYNNGQGGTWTSNSSLPQGGLLGSSSKSLTNSNRWYVYGADTGTQTNCYSTEDGISWRTENSISYNAGWSCGSYMTDGTNHYLFAVGDYPSGTPVSRGVIGSGGTVTFSSYTSYPVYKSAGNAQRLTSKMLVFGGFTSTALNATRDAVYSTNGGGSWVSETAMPFSASSVASLSLVGPLDTRVYIGSGSSVYSRGDSSGTWRSETTASSSWGGGWGTGNGANKYIQLSNGQYQLVP